MRALPWPLGPIAHRGLHAAGRGIIENTPSAVAAAIAKGYAIEVDIQAAADFEPIVFHDESIDRLLEGHGLVAHRSAADLKTIPYRSCGDRIMTLDELLEMIGGRVQLYVEVKTIFGPVGPYEREIARRVGRYRGPLALMSFDPWSVAALRSLVPHVPRGIVSYRWDDDWMPHVPAAVRRDLGDLAHAGIVDPHFIAYDIDDLPETAPARTRAAGLPLLTWTVRTPEHRARAAAHADAMIFESFEP